MLKQILKHIIMAKSIPIKTDLFRFVTFRSPEPLLLSEKSIRYVLHPDFKKSIVSSIPTLHEGENVKNTLEKAGLKGYESYVDVQNINPELYDFANYALKKRLKISDFEKAIDITKLKLLDGTQVIALFDQLFYQFLVKNAKVVRQAIIQMLVFNHIIKNYKELVESKVDKVTSIKIEIPYQLMQWYKPGMYGKCGGSLDGVQSLGIADFRRVEQEACCYVPGEVSHIENVMAREYKERSSRNYIRTEDTVETTKETEKENLSDITTNTRNEMSSEIASVMQQNNSSAYGASLGVSAKYLGTTINANTYADFANSNSSTYSNAEARSYAEEVTRQALERIVQKVSEKRTSTIIKEFEENNKHGFDNRKGDTHVTGIYRWIDLIYKNRLVNYGKRLMIEFMVPEPSEFYKRMQNYDPSVDNNSDGSSINQEKILSLEDLGINSYKDINRENFADLGREYGINIQAPLADSKTITEGFNPTPPIDYKNEKNWTRQHNIIIDPNYEAERASGDYSFRWYCPDAVNRGYFTLEVGNIKKTHSDLYSTSQKTTTGSFSGLLNPKLSQSAFIQTTGRKLYGYTINVILTCKLKNSVYEAWQLETYNKLLDAYNSLIAEQESEGEDSDVIFDNYTTEETVNPAMNRIIEQRELKRICLEMIMKPYCRKQGRNCIEDYVDCENYAIPQVLQNEEFTSYVSQVKFFEQAFDWDIISYLFYPYYWAGKCTWGELMKKESGDPIFQAFLQSGMARVVVPVRLEFTEAVLHYLETGDIWLGNELVPGTQDDLYLSITEEMQEVEGVVEDEWETRVPTSLALIQGKSAYLELEGLPCCHKLTDEGLTNNISPSDDLLGILNETE